MLFKIIVLGIIFFILRNVFRSWQTLQEVEKHMKKNQSKGPKNSAKDSIDAEYTVVDDK